MARANETLKKQLDAFNKHDASGLAAHYSPDASVFDPAYPEPLRGPDAVKKDFSEFITAFPDLEAEIERVVESGDTVAYELKFKGTHKGPLVSPAGAFPATNRKIEMKGAAFARFDNQGRITEERRYYDMAGLLDQLGAK